MWHGGLVQLTYWEHACTDQWCHFLQGVSNGMYSVQALFELFANMALADKLQHMLGEPGIHHLNSRYNHCVASVTSSQLLKQYDYTKGIHSLTYKTTTCSATTANNPSNTIVAVYCEESVGLKAV